MRRLSKLRLRLCTFIGFVGQQIPVEGVPGPAPTPTPSPTLNALGGTFTLPENSAQGTSAGMITGATAESTLTLLDNAGGRVQLSGANIQAGPTALDFETGTSHQFTVRETLAGATNTPRDTVLTLTVTDVDETPSTADYTITSTADWATIPQSVLDNGGLVEVDPAGDYSNLSIDVVASAPVIIRSAHATLRPVLPNAQCIKLGNTIIERLLFTAPAWGPTALNALDFNNGGGGSATITGIAGFRDCIVRGNYRADMNAYQTFDANAEYPEYACVAASITDGVYQTGALTITKPFVGDLVADGTHPLLAGEYTNGQGSGMVGTFTVSGGNIVAAEITNGGSGYRNTTSNGHEFRTLTWTGQNRMTDYMPRAIGGSMTLDAGGACEFIWQDNLVQMCSNGFKPNITCGNATVRNIGNTYDLCYMDTGAFGVNGTVPPRLLQHNWNKTTRPFAVVGDAGDPHGDLTIQHWLNSSDFSNKSVFVECIGNECFIGNSRATEGQVIFLADTRNGNVYHAYIAGNVGLAFAPHGMGTEESDGCYVFGNTMVANDHTEPGYNSAVSIKVSGGSSTPDAFAQSFVSKNIAEAIGINASAVPYVQSVDNVVLGLKGGSIPYGNVFNDTSIPADLAELRSKRATKAPYTDHGAYRDPLWINHTNRTHDRTREPSFMAFPNKVNQAADTVVWSDWCRLIGGPDVQDVEPINGAVFQTATFARRDQPIEGQSGTFSATQSVARGTWIRQGHTTAAAAATAKSTALRVRGTDFTFATITAAADYPQVDNGGTAYSVMASGAPSTPDLAKLLVAMRFKMDSYVNGMNLLANATAGNLRLYYASNQWRLTMVNTSTVAARMGMSQDAGVWKTLLFVADLTKADIASGGLIAVENGVQLTANGLSTFDSTAGAKRFNATELWNTSLGALAQPGGTNIVDGGIEFLWMDYFTAGQALPDILNPSMQAKFSSSGFAADGSIAADAGAGTPAVAQPAIFFHQSAGQTWDTSIANRGRIGGTLAKQAGTYT